MIKSKKGNYIVEAAVVLPVIVIVVITMVLIILYFYEHVHVQSRMHIAVRCKAEEYTGNTIYQKSPEWQGEISSENTAFGARFYGKGEVTMINRGILRNNSKKQLECRYYSTDGPKYVRKCNLIGNILNNGK